VLKFRYCSSLTKPEVWIWLPSTKRLRTIGPDCSVCVLIKTEKFSFSEMLRRELHPFAKKLYHGWITTMTSSNESLWKLPPPRNQELVTPLSQCMQWFRLYCSLPWWRPAVNQAGRSASFYATVELEGLRRFMQRSSKWYNFVLLLVSMFERSP